VTQPSSKEVKYPFDVQTTSDPIGSPEEQNAQQAPGTALPGTITRKHPDRLQDQSTHRAAGYLKMLDLVEKLDPTVEL
jgi:hypothetical protein